MSRVLLLLLLATPASAGTFQYAVAATDAGGKESRAFLWVPPKAERIRGVLVGGTTLMEPAFATDPLVRRACADEQLAIVYFTPPLDAVFDYVDKKSGDRLQKALDDLAAASGHREIATAPLFPFGHSVSSIFASHVVCWKPNRCFGALLFKGGIRQPANDPMASLAGVPILVVKGQFEEFGPGPNGTLRDDEDRETAWKTMRDTILALRKKDANHLVGYLVEPGASHFAWSDRLAEEVSRFLRAAAKARIADAGDCKPIDPASGVVSSPDLGREKPGPHAVGFWHLNADLAKRADAFHADLFARKPQYVTFADPATGKPIAVGHDLRLKLPLTWVGADRFQVAGTFWDRVPDKYPKVEGGVGHAEGPVRVRVYGGTAEAVAADTFRVTLGPLVRPRVDLLAYHPGDATYRYAEQQGRLTIPEKLTAGKEQTIRFEPPGPLKPGGVKLNATSDSGLEVRFYFESGPARIVGGMLEPFEVPARWKGGAVVVVAYQYGSAVEPLVRSAEVRVVVPMP